MSILSKIVRDAGHTIDKGLQDTLDEIARSPKFVEGLGRDLGLIGRGGIGELWGAGKSKGRGKGGGRKPPFVPPPYSKTVDRDMIDLLDDLEDGDDMRCRVAGAKPWTISSTVIINAGALAADTDLGTTSANPFSSTNSSFFTTAGVFPQPFLCYGIAGSITATLTTDELARGNVIDAFYMSMRASTELARFSMTRDLGFMLNQQQGLTAAAAIHNTDPSDYVPWRQFFDTRTTYVWGARLPRAVTSVGAVGYSLILKGVLYEGGSAGSR